LVAVLAGTTYALAWQRQAFGDEVAWFEAVRGTNPSTSVPPAWRALLAQADALSGTFGVGAQTWMCWLSAACTAAALLAFGAAVRRVEPCAGAASAALVVATSPAVLCAATASQPHALVLLAASLALLALALAGTRGHALAAVLVGALVGVAPAFDASALLLPAWLVPLVPILAREGTGRRRLWLASVTGIGFVAVAGGLWLAGPASSTAADLTASAPPGGALVAYVAKETLRAFLPLSVVVVACAWSRRGGLARSVVVAGAASAVAAAWLFGTHPVEGLALLSLVLPAGLVAARHLSRRWYFVVISLGAVLGATKLTALAGDGSAHAFLRGLRAEVAEPDPVLLTSGDGPDHQACVLWLPAATATRVADVVAAGGSLGDGFRAGVVERLRGVFAAGRRVFLTHEAEALLRRPAVHDGYPAAAVLLEVLLAEFEVVQRERGRFRAKELRPRAGR